MIEEIRVYFIIIKISNVNMCILCNLKGQCLNHDLVAHVYEYMGAEGSKLRQHMRAIFAVSRAQFLLLVVTRSRELSRECHVTKHKTPARSNFPLSNFENSGTFNSAHRALEGCAPTILKKGRTLKYKGKLEKIRELNPQCNIFFCPVLPSRSQKINEKIFQFIGLLFDDLVKSSININLERGLGEFLDRGNLIA